MYKYPVVDLVKTGENITRLMNENHITVKDLQDVFGFGYPQVSINGNAVIVYQL